MLNALIQSFEGLPSLEMLQAVSEDDDAAKAEYELTKNRVHSAVNSDADHV